MYKWIFFFRLQSTAIWLIILDISFYRQTYFYIIIRDDSNNNNNIITTRRDTIIRF